MKIPDLNAFCAKPAPAATGICIRFPGGAKICLPDAHTGSPIEQVRGLLKLANTALMPLQPFFSVLNVIKAVKDVFDALPGLISDPKALIDAIGKFVKAFGALVALFPQLSVPILVKDILAMVAFLMRAIAKEMEAFAAMEQQIAESASLASRLGLASLTAEVSCAQDAFDISMSNFNASLGPIAEILGLVNVLLGLAGLPEIKVALSESGSPSEAIAAMNEIANVLDTAASAIPL